jgi:hypothetical protein
MDHRGLRARLAGAACTSCGAAIPGDRIDVLADRGDLAFVELSCPVCPSRTMEMVLELDEGPRAPVLDTAAHPQLARAFGASPTGRPVVSGADVRAMRAFLAGWEGDIRSMLADAGRHGPGADR